MASNPNMEICMAVPKDQHPMQWPSRRRKVKGGGGQKKRTPQRGMGVAQLEQLRVQEWKKMINFPVASSFVDPTPVHVSGLVQFPKLRGFGAAPNKGVGEMLFNGKAGFRGFVSDYHFQADLFEAKGISNNLDAVSWNPNGVKSCTPLCIACQEKKKISGQNLSCCGMKPEFNGCRFLGINVGQNTHNFKRENQELAAKVLRPEPGVEIVAVHKKGSSPTSSSEAAGDASVMEYEFFPSGKGMKSNIMNSNNNEYVMMKLMAAGWGSDSAALRSTGNFDGSAGSVDLSLKLSY